MRNIFFSVIIPTYNTERSIRRCLNALLTQTYKKFEIILVDDASTDQTVDIVNEEYGEQFEKMTVIRKNENVGPSAARNSGLDVAEGVVLTYVKQQSSMTKTGRK